MKRNLSILLLLTNIVFLDFTSLKFNKNRTTSLSNQKDLVLSNKNPHDKTKSPVKVNLKNLKPILCTNVVVFVCVYHYHKGTFNELSSFLTRFNQNLKVYKQALLVEKQLCLLNAKLDKGYPQEIKDFKKCVSTKGGYLALEFTEDDLNLGDFTSLPLVLKNKSNSEPELVKFEPIEIECDFTHNKKKISDHFDSMTPSEYKKLSEIPLERWGLRIQRQVLDQTLKGSSISDIFTCEFFIKNVSNEEKKLIYAYPKDYVLKIKLDDETTKVVFLLQEEYQQFLTIYNKFISLCKKLNIKTQLIFNVLTCVNPNNVCQEIGSNQDFIANFGNINLSHMEVLSTINYQNYDTWSRGINTQLDAFNYGTKVSNGIYSYVIKIFKEYLVF